MRLRPRAALLAMILLGGCAVPPSVTQRISLPNLAVQPVQTSALSQATPDINVIVKYQSTEVYCPTESAAARTFYNDAIAAADTGNTKDAIRLYEEAIDLDPAFCDAMDNLGRLLRTQGNLPEAIQWYQRSLAVFPANPVAHQNLAIAYLMQNEVDKAVGEYELLVELAPENPEGYYGLGNIHLYAFQEPAAAVPFFEMAVKLYAEAGSPYLADAQYAIGVAHFMSGDYVSARDALESVYPSLRDEAGINYYLGLCYLTRELYDREQARRYLDSAQALGAELPAEVIQMLE